MVSSTWEKGFGQLWEVVSSVADVTFLEAVFGKKAAFFEPRLGAVDVASGIF